MIPANLSSKMRKLKQLNETGSFSFWTCPLNLVILIENVFLKSFPFKNSMLIFKDFETQKVSQTVLVPFFLPKILLISAFPPIISILFKIHGLVIRLTPEELLENNRELISESTGFFWLLKYWILGL